MRRRPAGGVADPQAPVTIPSAGRFQARGRGPREGGWRRVLYAVTGLVLLAGLGYAVMFTPLTAVRSVTVSGTATVNPARLRAVAAGAVGVPLARVDTAAIAARARSIPRVAGVTVVRRWPSTLALIVDERIPVASVAPPAAPAATAQPVVVATAASTAPAAPSGAPPSAPTGPAAGASAGPRSADSPVAAGPAPAPSGRPRAAGPPVAAGPAPAPSVGPRGAGSAISPSPGPALPAVSAGPSFVGPRIASSAGAAAPPASAGPAAAPAARPVWRVVDASGTTLAQSSKPVRGLPVITALGEHPDLSLRAALDVLTGLPSALQGRVRQVRATTPEDVSLRLTDGSRVIWGAADRAERKGIVLNALLGLHAKVYDVSAPDVPTTR